MRAAAARRSRCARSSSFARVANGATRCAPGALVQGRRTSSTATTPVIDAHPRVAARAISPGEVCRHRLISTLEMRGAPFELRVWNALRKIPPGTTTTYGAIAREIGSPDASRAVGMANGANPIAIIVPCHRVIGSNGTLTGYGGGLETKSWLLSHERRWATSRSRRLLLHSRSQEMPCRSGFGSDSHRLSGRSLTSVLPA